MYIFNNHPPQSHNLNYQFLQLYTVVQLQKMASTSQNSAARSTASILLPPQTSPEPVPITEPQQPSLSPQNRVVTYSQLNIHKRETICDFMDHLSPTITLISFKQDKRPK